MNDDTTNGQAVPMPEGDEAKKPEEVQGETPATEAPAEGEGNNA